MKRWTCRRVELANLAEDLADLWTCDEIAFFAKRITLHVISVFWVRETKTHILVDRNWSSCLTDASVHVSHYPSFYSSYFYRVKEQFGERCNVFMVDGWDRCRGRTC